jgi:hypothetical protein
VRRARPMRFPNRAPSQGKPLLVLAGALNSANTIGDTARRLRNDNHVMIGTSALYCSSRPIKPSTQSASCRDGDLCSKLTLSNGGTDDNLDILTKRHEKPHQAFN